MMAFTWDLAIYPFARLCETVPSNSSSACRVSSDILISWSVVIAAIVICLVVVQGLVFVLFVVNSEHGVLNKGALRRWRVRNLWSLVHHRNIPVVFALQMMCFLDFLKNMPLSNFRRRGFFFVCRWYLNMGTPGPRIISSRRILRSFTRRVQYRS